jgi:hypothetical protein
MASLPRVASQAFLLLVSDIAKGNVRGKVPIKQWYTHDLTTNSTMDALLYRVSLVDMHHNQHHHETGAATTSKWAAFPVVLGYSHLLCQHGMSKSSFWVGGRVMQ